MKKIIIAFLFIISGCASKIEVPASFTYKEIQTDGFRLASWQKIEQPNKPFYIFIEGDGHSFTSRGRPTSNPTPRGGTLRKIAFTSTQANVVYLGRPCQFVTDETCVQTDWTTARFSQKAVDSTAQAIKSITNQPVTLIGFSGGAQIAGLVAVLNPEIKIKKLISIAGNLDHEAWVKKKKLIPLKDSISLADYRKQYLKFPQLHYVGEKDTVIPKEITYDFVDNENLIILYPEASHGYGWDKVNID